MTLGLSDGEIIATDPVQRELAIDLIRTARPDVIITHAPNDYMDTLAGVGFLPAEYVDVTMTIDVKLDALRCHRSQLDFLLDHDGVDVVEQTRVVNAFRGFQSGVRYAEGFTPVPTWLRTHTHRLLP